MTHTCDHVRAAATAAFTASELVSILAELDRYGIEPHERERERVHLAIVALSEGKADRVVHYVQIAKTDYRDVLAWQQTGAIQEIPGEKLQTEARAVIEKWGKR